MGSTKVRGRSAVGIGAVVEGRGMYLGPWEAAPGHPVHAYVEDDFLRDQAGKALTLSFNEAVIELARRNQAWAAGNGTEAALREEIAKGNSDFEGKSVLPPNALLEDGIYAGLNAGTLPRVAEALQLAVHERKPDQLWALSSTQHPQSKQLVRMFRLRGGISARCYVDNYRTSILPVRMYRTPAVT